MKLYEFGFLGWESGRNFRCFVILALFLIHKESASGTKRCSSKAQDPLPYAYIRYREKERCPSLTKCLQQALLQSLFHPTCKIQFFLTPFYICPFQMLHLPLKPFQEGSLGIIWFQFGSQWRSFCLSRLFRFSIFICFDFFKACLPVHQTGIPFWFSTFSGKLLWETLKSRIWVDWISDYCFIHK